MSRALVNGLSPQIVFPGAKITIRGENLGYDIDDIINLWICGEDCKPFIESRTDTKIIAHVGRTPRSEDPYVIVVTKSGGEGECTIRLTITDRVDRISLGTEVPIWMEEENYYPDSGATNGETGMIRPSQKNLFGTSVPCKPSDSSRESDPSSNAFDPVKYLLDKHGNVTVSDLQAGVTYLDRQCGQHTSTDIQFVKSHIDVLLSCHDTLVKVAQCIDEEEEIATGGSLTGPLDTVLNECNKCAEQLFSSILNKKDKADRIRNALNVIERFRFLFGLPDNIDKNIHSKAYDIVLNDYKKAKSLFADSQVHVFQQVMDGVHGKIRSFSRDLQERLLEPRCPLSEKKQLLKYLVEFEDSSSSDPAWESLKKQQEKVIQYITNSKLEFKDRLHNFVALEKFRAKKVQTRRENSVSPLINQFIDELCDTVTQSLPDYWALCQAYLDGSLSPEVKKAQLVQLDSFISPPPTPHCDCRSPMDHELDVQELIGQVMDLLSSVIQQYCLNMDFKFNNEQDSEYAVVLVSKSQQHWTPTTVKRVKMCVERLLAINIPIPCLRAALGLVDSMQHLCVKCLFDSAERNIRELYSRETWEISAERGHTALPLLFQNTVLSLLATVKEVMEGMRYKESVPAQTCNMNHSIQEMFYSVVISFADCLKHLTDLIEAENSEESGDSASPCREGCSSPSSTEERLVLILGNCRHTILTIIPTLLETFKSHGYIATNDDTIDNNCLERYSTLERSIFDKYVNSKDGFLFGDILQFLEPESFPWAYCNSPAGISVYVQELGLKLVMSQAELHNIEKDLMRRIVGHLLENVTVKVCGMIAGVDRFCKNGALQARLDLLACLVLFRNNMTTKCRNSMEDTLNSIPTVGITAEDEAILGMLLDRFKAHNTVMLACLDYSPEGEKHFSPGQGDTLARRRSQMRILKPKVSTTKLLARSPPSQKAV